MTAKSGRQLTSSIASTGSYNRFGEPGGRRQREMAARREADHADPLRVDAPLRGPAADQADGPLGVELRAQRPARLVRLPADADNGT